VGGFYFPHALFMKTAATYGKPAPDVVVVDYDVFTADARELSLTYYLFSLSVVKAINGHLLDQAKATEHLSNRK
jgi:hypothetical protein